MLLSPALRAQTLPIFDAHLHYDADQQAIFKPEAVINILDRNHVVAALVTGIPPGNVLSLRAVAPARIVPFLGVYRKAGDKQDWYTDKDLPARVEKALENENGPWRGIGELHIFAEHRRAPVFKQLVDIAADHHLVLQMHCDPAVIDALFEQRPDATVIWAHAGRYPYPPLLRDYIERYPNLYVDLSTRDERLSKKNSLDTEWELLLLEHTDRFMVGVDTYSEGRWESFGAINGETRAWLRLLPGDVAKTIACDNAARLFAMPVCDGGK